MQEHASKRLLWIEPKPSLKETHREHALNIWFRAMKKKLGIIRRDIVRPRHLLNSHLTFRSSHLQVV